MCMCVSVHMYLTYDPVVPLLGVFQHELKPRTQPVYTPMFITLLMTVTGVCRQLHAQNTAHRCWNIIQP